MSEDEFYKILDNVEKIETDITDGYYPTVQELEENGVDKNPEKYIRFLAYFASDPFTRMNLIRKEEPGYKACVSFSKRLLYTVKVA